jgi:hypothetical protein
MSEERRRHERYPLTVEVELTDSSLGKIVVTSRDVSDSGVFLRIPVGSRPAVGTVVRLRVHGAVGGEDPPLVTARVVREVAEGIGLEFLDSTAE